MRETLDNYRHAIYFISVLISIYLLYRLFTIFYIYEDDAYIEARIIKVAPNVSGPIVKRPITDLQAVKKGDVLFEIDKRPYEDAYLLAKSKVLAAQTRYQALQAKLVAAKNDLTSNLANLKFQNEQLARYQKLTSDNVTSIEKRDNTLLLQKQAQEDVAIAKARIKQIEIQLGSKKALYPPLKEALAEQRLAHYNLSQTVVKSPVDGYVTAMFTEVGDYALKGQALFAIVDNNHWWVVARIKEDYIAGLNHNETTIWLGTGETFTGKVKGAAWAVNRKEEGGYQKWSLLPYLKKTEHWINLAQRFPVVIEFNANNKPLHMGASATVLIKR